MMNTLTEQYGYVRVSIRRTDNTVACVDTTSIGDADKLGEFVREQNRDRDFLTRNMATRMAFLHLLMRWNAMGDQPNTPYIYYYGPVVCPK